MPAPRCRCELTYPAPTSVSWVERRAVKPSRAAHQDDRSAIICCEQELQFDLKQELGQVSAIGVVAFAVIHVCNRSPASVRRSATMIAYQAVWPIGLAAGDRPGAACRHFRTISRSSLNGWPHALRSRASVDRSARPRSTEASLGPVPVSILLSDPWRHDVRREVRRIST